MKQPWIYMCSPSLSPLPPRSPTHPSGSSQCTSPEHLSHASNLGNPICFTLDNVLVSMLFSQNILPSPSPTESNICSIHHVSFSVTVDWRFYVRTAIWPSNPTPGNIHRGNQIWKRQVHPNIHRSTVYNSQDMETTYMPISRRMDKEAVVHIHHGILVSH